MICDGKVWLLMFFFFCFEMICKQICVDAWLSQFECARSERETEIRVWISILILWNAHTQSISYCNIGGSPCVQLAFISCGLVTVSMHCTREWNERDEIGISLEYGCESRSVENIHRSLKVWSMCRSTVTSVKCHWKSLLLYKLYVIQLLWPLVLTKFFTAELNLFYLFELTAHLHLLYVVNRTGLINVQLWPYICLHASRHTSALQNCAK